MTLGAMGCAELGIHAWGGGVYVRKTTSDAIVSSPVLAGTHAYSIDPVNGNGDDQYGWGAGVHDDPDLLAVSFLLRIEDFFDENVVIAEIGEFGIAGDSLRRLVFNTSEQLAILDKDNDQVGITGASYLAADTLYWVLWRLDRRSATATRDMLWVFKGSAWDTSIDVSNHGDVAGINLQQLTFGTEQGKGTLPTTGGPFYVKNMVMQNLGKSPHTTPYGSFTVKIKMANANGSFSDFDIGTGTNPDWNDVKEIPADDAISDDQGDDVGNKQSYAIANADSGDAVLAVQVVGVGQRGGGAGAGVTLRCFLYDGTTRDLAVAWAAQATWKSLLNLPDDYKTWNQVNGIDMSESLFNSLEAGLELVIVLISTPYQLTQIGLEYGIEGAKARPDDFPFDPVVPDLLSGGFPEIPRQRPVSVVAY